MSKFHVGDRVRIHAGSTAEWIGNVGTVLAVDDPVRDNIPYKVQMDNYAYGYEFFGDQHLVPETITAQAERDNVAS